MVFGVCLPQKPAILLTSQTRGELVYGLKPPVWFYSALCSVFTIDIVSHTMFVTLLKQLSTMPRCLALYCVSYTQA